MSPIVPDYCPAMHTVSRSAHRYNLSTNFTHPHSGAPAPRPNLSTSYPPAGATMSAGHPHPSREGLRKNRATSFPLRQSALPRRVATLPRVPVPPRLRFNPATSCTGGGAGSPAARLRLNRSASCNLRGDALSSPRVRGCTRSNGRRCAAAVLRGCSLA